MLRLMFPLVLIAAIAAAHGAHAQAAGYAGGDRYGPRSAPVGAPAGGPRPASPTPLTPPPVPPQAVSAAVQGPALRRLTWPGKAELRPALAPVNYVAPSAAPRPAWTPSAPASAAAAARFPGMAVYGAAPPQPAPALRGAHAATYADANTPLPSSTWTPMTARARTRGPSTSARAAAPPPATSDMPVGPPPPTRAARPARAVAPSFARAPSPALDPAVAPVPALAASPVPADALPPPAMGRYGYVGPGRDAAQPSPVARAPVPPSAAPDGAGALGAPRPPAYARAYVLPTAATATAAAPASGLPPPPVTPARSADGVRRYSVHREFGEEPDPIRLSPQTLSAAPDLSAPETPEVAPRTGAAAGKAQVNAARLAAAGPG